MDLRNYVLLHDVDSMTTLLANNEIIGATKEEVKALYEVFEGHGYHLYATDLKAKEVIRIDTEEDLVDDYIVANEDSWNAISISDMVSEGWNKLDDLVNEYHNEHDTNIEEKYKNWYRGVCTSRNLVSDLYSRIIDKDRDKLYIVTSEICTPSSLVSDVDTFIFRTEIEAKKKMLNMVEEVLENEEDFEEVDFLFFNDFDINDKFHQEIFILNQREESSFCLVSETDGMTRMTLDRQVDKLDEVPSKPTMEFYCVTEFYQNFEVYDTFLETRHYKTKEEAEKNYNWVMGEFKNKYVEDGELGEFDTLDEYGDDKNRTFELYIDNVCRAEVNFEKVVL